MVVHGGAMCDLREFGMVSQVHDVEKRHITLSVSLPSTGKNGSKAFKFNGIKSWNTLTLNRKNETHDHILNKFCIVIL